MDFNINRPINKPPHLVMMVIDDLGWTDVGFHGSNFPTPHIDTLAASGVRLEKFYVQQVCSPTRSALMTARYPFKTGLQHATTLMPGSSSTIPKDTATLAEVLKQSGYYTHAIGTPHTSPYHTSPLATPFHDIAGKWHIGYAGWDDTPLGRGFDSHAGYLQVFRAPDNQTSLIVLTSVDYRRAPKTTTRTQLARRVYSRE